MKLENGIGLSLMQERYADLPPLCDPPTMVNVTAFSVEFDDEMHFAYGALELLPTHGVVAVFDEISRQLEARRATKDGPPKIERETQGELYRICPFIVACWPDHAVCESLSHMGYVMIADLHERLCELRTIKAKAQA